MKKTLLASLIAAMGIVASGAATADVIAGINFGNSLGDAHLETATLAETLVTAVGDKAEGYGQITTVNGSNAYCAGGDGTQCQLYYYYHDFMVTDIDAFGTHVQLSGGFVDIYRHDGAAVNLLDFASTTNVGFITSLTPYLRLTGHTFFDPILVALGGGVAQTLNGFGSLTGASLSVTGAGLLDADTTGAFADAAIANYFDTNTIKDNNNLAGGTLGFADVAITSSTSNLVKNKNDTCDGVTSGQWCLQGTLNARGVLVPEPASLALLGLGLLGLGVARRSKRSA